MLSGSRSVSSHLQNHFCCALSAVLIEKLGTYTVKPVLSGHSKIDKTKVLKTDGSFNEGQKYCSVLPLEHSAILLTCIKRFSVFFLSGRLRQVLLYIRNCKYAVLYIHILFVFDEELKGSIQSW